jgi:hypothetical protein|tara:strand:+ start:574 stop:885 length:312 start_codon:yes stop_codon:yes gene_type:complete
MSGLYATGKRSKGICDRCGQQYDYLSLRKEWTGFKVCSECYEPKAPQLQPHAPPPDPQALKDPRVDRIEPFTVPVGEGKIFPPSSSAAGLTGITSLGTVVVVA